MTKIKNPTKHSPATRRKPPVAKGADAGVAVSSEDLATQLLTVVKAESQILSNALEVEDGFANEYGGNIVEPEIPPERFASLVEQNNTLSQCISAMEVNIDGTGYEIVRADKVALSTEDKIEVAKLDEFFSEVYPATSLTTVRRQNRRYLESVGYSCIEVIRNPKGDIIFLRTLDPKTIRLMKLGPSVPAKKSITRGGTTLTVNLQVRERIFVQMINTNKVYFKEFGASRDLDKKTGKWAQSGSQLPADTRSSEIIYLTVNKSVKTAYGVPRWLNNLPSVIGSRSAEELNLEYFDSGGVPPLMVLIAGGSMGAEALKQIRALLSGKAKEKLRGVVADIHSTTGDIHKGGGVSVQVETFDSARQQDSMFETYDEKCEKRTRGSWRLPPLFVGKAEDYSFASVFASYTLGEAQVFSPERDEFDEAFNNTIMKVLTGGLYLLRSKPLTVADATSKLKALELAAKHRVVSRNQLREGLNVSSDLDIPMEEEDGELEDLNSMAGGRRVNDPGIDPNRSPTNPGAGQQGDIPPVTKADLSYLGDIANEQVRILLKGGTPNEKVELGKQLETLNSTERNMVMMLTSNKVFVVTENDSAGMTELLGSIVAER